MAERTYFRCCSSEEDPEQLLDPDQHVTMPWGSADHGACDKCGGRGSVPYRCLSCLEAGPDPGCPACGGRVEFVDTCPACEGSGEISRTERKGVAVFPTAAGLYRYLAEREAEAAGSKLVELEGCLGDDRDLDADAGALLIHPTAIVAVKEIDADLIESLRERLGSVEPAP